MKAQRPCVECVLGDAITRIIYETGWDFGEILLAIMAEQGLQAPTDAPNEHWAVYFKNFVPDDGGRLAPPRFGTPTNPDRVCTDRNLGDTVANTLCETGWDFGEIVLAIMAWKNLASPMDATNAQWADYFWHWMPDDGPEAE